MADTRILQTKVGMFVALKTYYRKNSMQLGTALFAVFAAATIQIKYWVFYGHDCLRLNPYQVVKKPAERHKKHFSRNTQTAFGQADSDCRGGPEASKELPVKHEKHDHDRCPICQSFQQLTAAIFEPGLHPLLASHTQSCIPAFSAPIFFYSQKEHSEASPRAPPAS